MSISTPSSSDHPQDPRDNRSTTRLNWLRAAVLGANDGIVSTAGIVVGVAGATSSNFAIIAAGVAGVAAGSLSMAVGEYVSVSSQRDSEKAQIERERQALVDHPDEELQELHDIYLAKGLSPKTAKLVAAELTAHDALADHIDAEHGLDPDNLTNPTHAAIASALSFLSGSIIPMAAIVLAPTSLKVPITFVAVIVALGLTGTLSAIVGEAGKRRATLRVLVGGVAAMIVTYAIGRLVGISGL
jgi:VIT1/CCC1 family predicted Fe2+/Mn2+ transporter